jgi:hypothetical protein
VFSLVLAQFHVVLWIGHFPIHRASFGILFRNQANAQENHEHTQEVARSRGSVKKREKVLD